MGTYVVLGTDKMASVPVEHLAANQLIFPCQLTILFLNIYWLVLGSQSNPEGSFPTRKHSVLGDLVQVRSPFSEAW